MTEKKVSPNAYQALHEALPVVFHYKRPFETFLRSALHDHPELLAGVNFGDLKRSVADRWCNGWHVPRRATNRPPST